MDGEELTMLGMKSFAIKEREMDIWGHGSGTQ